MSVSPFPWKSLDTVRRGDLALLAKMRRATSRWIDAASAENALRDLIGPCELSIHVRRVTRTPARVDDTAVAALIAPAERADRRHAFAIVIEQALANALASRALERPSARVIDPARPSPSLAGAVAAILIAVARRHAPTPLRVITAGPAHEIVAEIVSIDPMPIAITFTVLLDHDAYLAQVLAPRDAIEPIAEIALDAHSLAALGEMPIEAPLVAAVLEMTTAELAALAHGDALLPLTIAHGANGFHGELLIAPQASDVALRADLGDDGRLVLRDGPLPIMEEEMVDKDVLAQSIGETPVVVRVEVGSAQMSAREWASLGAGDVIAIGKRVGDHVVLRVGGVEVARGELVDIEGEIGVRIVARTGGTQT